MRKGVGDEGRKEHWEVGSRDELRVSVQMKS